VQGSWSAIRSKGQDGYQWWVLGAHDAREAFSGDLHGAAAEIDAAEERFAAARKPEKNS